MADVVVITGASAGVGRAVARMFAQDGANIGLIARGRQGLEATRREVEELGGQALVCPLDVSDADAVEAAAGRIERALGPIDIWVNNAMVTVFAPVSQITPEEFERVTQVTYLGSVYGTMAALRRMRERDRGVIVQVGSALAYHGIPLQAAYCGAKHGVNGFLDALRAELAHEGSQVRLTSVHLPAMNTPQFDWCRVRVGVAPQPVPPIFQPEVAARTIHRAAYGRRREWWVGGPTVQLIVGDKVAPALVDWYLGRYGVQSQLTDQRVAPDRPDNLFHPVEGDRGARGRFDDRSSGTSLQAWASRNRLGAAVLTGVAGLALWTAGRRLLA